MKKTYIAPNVKTAELETTSLIADSDSMDFNSSPATQSLGMDVKEDYSTKFKSLWDEEW